MRLDLSGNKVEIVSKFTLSKYYIRYLTKPTPIILIDLPDGVTIENLNMATPCKVHESLHQMILELAVNKVLQIEANSVYDDTFKVTNNGAGDMEFEVYASP